MRVLKFGGTSLADAERISKVAHLIHAAADESPLAVVVSAQAGVTDLLAGALLKVAGGESGVEALRAELGRRHLRCLDLLALADDQKREVGSVIHRRLLELTQALRQIAQCGYPRPEHKAAVLATGERLNAPLVAAALHRLGRPAQVLDAGELIVTKGSLLDADPDLEATRLKARLRLASWPKNVIPVITGFLGSDRRGQTTLLGRGGSDTSATILGYALLAERVEIWTDVDGVLSADPRRQRDAVLLPFLSFDEAESLARRGAKVLHHKSVAPARAGGVPILVRNTFRPEVAGTWISREGRKGQPAAA